MAGSKRGMIIYFDGPDGVGKTTQLQLVANLLRNENIPVHATRTMGGTPIGEMLREALLSGNDRPVETDLYVALASQYALAEEIMERRKKGRIVLVDRSPLSITAYQVHGDGLQSKKGYQAAKELLEHIKPDLIIIYKAATSELKVRRKIRNQNLNRDFFEIKPFEYHAKVAKGFDEAARRFKADVINAGHSIEAVHDATMELIRPLIKT